MTTRKPLYNSDGEKVITFVGSQTGTFANTEAEDGNYHQITHSANDLDIVYQFDIGGGRTGVELTFKGYLSGGNDAAVVQAYDFIGADWETITTLTGQAGTDNITLTAPLLSKHTGTGADIGTVLIRIDGQGDDSSPELFTDLLQVAAVSINQTVGYANGAVWVNTSASNTNTESFVDGVADNPVSTIAAANTVLTNVGLTNLYIVAGSSITFAASQTSQTFHGEGWTLALGGQDISNSHFYEAIVSGTGTTASGNPDWHMCDIGTATIGPSDFHNCEFQATFTAGSAGTYFIHDCKSGVAGSGSPTMTFTGLLSATNVNVRNWFGGGTWNFDSDVTASIEVTKGGTHAIAVGGADVEFRGFCKAISLTGVAATSTVNLAVFTGTITVDGTAGTVNVYGQHSGVTDNSGGSVTINDFSVDGPAVGTNIGTVLTRLGTPSDLGGGSDLSTNLSDIAGATFSTTTDTLEAIRNRGDAAWTTGSGTGLTALASGTAQSGTASTIQLASGETFADDEPNGNVINITGGTGAGQSRVITDYTGATDTATVTPNWTTSPDNTSTYEMVAGSANVSSVSNAAEDLPTATALATVDTNVDAILVDTGTTIPAQISGLNDPTAAAIAAAVHTTAMTESYGTDGSDLTLAQAAYLILGGVSEFAISGTTKTVKQLDGTTTAATYTLDDANNPTSITRAT